MRSLFALLVVASPVLAKPTPPTKDIVIVRFDWTREPPPTMTLTAKDRTLTISGKGIFADGKKLCDWEAYPRPLGSKCPKDSPVQDAAFFGYHGESAEATPFTAIQVSSVEGAKITVPYQGRIYAGEVPQEFVVAPAKGTALEKQVAAEKAATRKNRDAELQKLGIAPVRQAIHRCLTPAPKEDCVRPHLPGGADRFDYSMLGEEKKLNLAEVFSLMKSDSDFAAAFRSCVAEPGPSYTFEAATDSASVVYDEEAEMHYYCTFARKSGVWRFVGLGWSGC